MKKTQLIKIGLFGVPRSGTSWLSQIFNSHPDIIFRFQPLFSYEHKGRITESSSRAEIDLFFEEIEQSKDPFALMQTDSHHNYPTFEKSCFPNSIAFKETRYLHLIENILVQCPDVRVVGIVRNPLTTLASWVKAPKEFNSDWDIEQEWRFAHRKNMHRIEEYNGFEKWKQVATDFLSFQKEYPEQFLLVRYEDLRKNPFDKTKELFQFCGLESSPQVEEFLVQSRSKYDPSPYSVFRSKNTGDNWQEILPAAVSDSIQSELSGTPLSTFIE
tara:strand:- start:90600 stop:91415 length:816 start_codon:yes stop_codon:yes gene_type:complete